MTYEMTYDWVIASVMLAGSASRVEGYKARWTIPCYHRRSQESPRIYRSIPPSVIELPVN